MKKYKNSIHIFRRDLRLEDNTSLISALENSEKVIPVFFLDPRQIEKHKYKSENAFNFMLNSLNELDQELKKLNYKLYIFHSNPSEILPKIIKEAEVEAIFFNKDYTPFSLKRDKEIKKITADKKIKLHVFSDCLLNEPEDVFKADGTPYTVFTPFFKKASTISVKKVKKNEFSNYYMPKLSLKTISIDEAKEFLTIKNLSPDLLLKGGRKEALKLLKQIKQIKNYDQERNIPSEQGTTHLSSHNKFGTLSIREFYWHIFKTFSSSHTLITELYWRDFFTHINYHFPKVLKGKAFREKYDKIKWSSDKTKLKAWQSGKTGFPIVDAGMRELNQTGYMHNRVRMIVASFLVKDLHIDWREGEKYFAQKLLDYDPAVNNGNWQWAASTGCDAQPYFRIFNPWLQQKRYDPDCKYIKKFVPELQTLSSAEIHKLNEKTLTNQLDYPKPIVDHSDASKFAKEMFKNV